MYTNENTTQKNKKYVDRRKKIYYIVYLMNKLLTDVKYNTILDIIIKRMKKHEDNHHY